MSSVPLSITADELIASHWIEVIDIRTEEERKILGFIPGSLRIDVEDLEALIRSSLTSSTVALVCNSGRRAREVLEEVELPDDVSVAYLEGGVLGWREGGFPCVEDDEDVAIPSAYRDVEIASAEEFVSLLRSCFVAELIEGPLSEEDGPNVDPVEIFDTALQSAGARGAPQEGLELIIDHLAAANRRLGGSLNRIAENTSVMRALLDGNTRLAG